MTTIFSPHLSQHGVADSHHQEDVAAGALPTVRK